MTVLVDPWGSNLIENYERLIKEFGLQVFNPNPLPDPNRLMRRRIVFGAQDMKPIETCIKKKKPFYTLSGVMPTGDKIHLGSKMVVENLKYFQDHGAHTYILVADLEASVVRDVTLEVARKRALQFHVPAYIALGLDPKKTTFYFQSDNMDVVRIGYDAARKLTYNEFRAAYGKATPGRIMGAVTQIGDMLFPQLKKRMPGVIPVGIDQAPHIRLCRDYIRKSRAHKYFMVSSIYHKYMPSLKGDFKMSKSQPESMLSLPESLDEIKHKIMRAKTGGRKTLAEHRRLGGEPDKCMVFELLKQHLVEDDKTLNKIYKDYKSGKMTSADIKTLALEKMTAFMKSFEQRLKKAKVTTKKLKFYA